MGNRSSLTRHGTARGAEPSLVAVWPVTSWSSARQTAPTRSGPARHRSASSIGSGLPQAFGYPPLEPLAGNWRTWNIRDGFIACWDAKYAYWSLRPVTAIRRMIDSNWLSYIVTPPFPSYVSGHSTTLGAAATVLWVSSPVAPASSRRWPRRQPSHDSTAASTTAPTTWWGLELARKVGSVALGVCR
jgi:hypothetical protein